MAKIHWYGPPSTTHRKVVRQEGVSDSTESEAHEIAGKAEVLLAPHHASNAPERDPGDSVSRIEVTTGNVDAFVNLVDDDGGAAAIEFYLAPMKTAAYSGLGGGSG